MPSLKETKNPSLIDTAFAYFFHRTDRLLRLHFTKLMSDHGEDITVEQWLLLNQLSTLGVASQTDLVDKTFKDRPNITRLLDGLEKKDLVAREDDSEDRRKFNVILTKKGKALLERTIPIMLQERKHVYKGLSSADLQTLKKISETIETNVLNGRL
ncbi:MarR family transcriptional regulator [Leptospira gomenensis]|uniref:MarR family transcriptional regulator n=1 Tax=Leptospira gomenensis TaxID=2484974 RepID=A0A5F1YKH6_9LEPT|nr:MarR family transcriptional regulator [Leptospira gomenensis]TGK33288.1 MarR family transcriptional regulator [Leptospira gomenensis]TGK45119.1 MarR family transcriptional regulator [Leptospira gomenensis]TGK50904.1 MarR family transcriptional regulator [Leptospira gomenensis]TGK56527.1 MarR family transcriptional regulator [Leptospira gomenensis]